MASIHTDLLSEALENATLSQSVIGVLGMKISIGVIIGICLIVYWYMEDHPRTAPPVKQGYETHVTVGVV